MARRRRKRVTHRKTTKKNLSVGAKKKVRAAIRGLKKLL